MKKFLSYYQEELLFLRREGKEFAIRHPEIAGKLDIKNAESTDPHTERIIESVAYMSAKLQEKIDDNVTNIAYHLLFSLYPNLINTFPSCSVVEFVSNLALGRIVNLPKGTLIYGDSKNGITCSFKTVYNIEIYPLYIKNSHLLKTVKKMGGIDGWCIEIEMFTKSIPIEKMRINNLLFHIRSQIINEALIIYESIFSDPLRGVFLKINNDIFPIDSKNLIPCGFDDTESICPMAPYSNNVFQLFQEGLNFKPKFMFFKLLNLDDILKQINVENIFELSLIIDISVKNERLLEESLKPDSFLLNAVPIVNLFEITSDPFRFDGTKNKYLLSASQTGKDLIEIHSICEVHKIDSQTKEDSFIHPYFSITTASGIEDSHDLFWIHTKQIVSQKHETFLSIVDTNVNPDFVYSDIIYAKTLCSNGSEPMEIPIFTKLNIDKIENGGYNGKLLYRPSIPISIIENSDVLWNLISQLTSTHISMASSQNLLFSIAKLIKILSCENVIKYEEFVGNIKKIETQNIVRRTGDQAWRGFVDGIKIDIFIKDLDKSYNSFLFCSILNEYLSGCICLNSFIELAMNFEFLPGAMSTWLPSSGRKHFL